MLRPSDMQWSTNRATEGGFWDRVLGRLTKSARGVSSTLSWQVSRKFWFAFLTIAIVCAKCLHLYAYGDSVAIGKLILWAPTFFVQDAIFLLLAFALTRIYERKWISILGALIVVIASLIVSTMAAANMSFFFFTGAEIHWRLATGFNKDPASINTMLTGLTGLIIVQVFFMVIGALSAAWLYRAVERMVSVWGAVLGPLLRGLLSLIKFALDRVPLSGKGKELASKVSSKLNSRLGSYESVPMSDYDDVDENSASNSAPLLERPLQLSPGKSTVWKIYLKRAAVIVPSILLVVLRMARPSTDTFWFLSQTVIVSPFTVVNSEAKLAHLFKDHTLDGKLTALTAVPEFDWFPSGSWPGFRDWETTAGGKNTHSHYNATEDPLHISNLDHEVLKPLREVFDNGDVNIKHVFVFKMESTRYDVFPLRKSSYLYQRIKESYEDKKIPKDVQQRLANLTPTAERLTGAPTGLHGNRTIKPYGGIRAEDSYTGGTFTLKSVVASVCGLAPLVADFNHEFEHNIYQPCMPHVLDVLSATTNTSDESDFRSWPWRSAFMQSITDAYDRQNMLTPALGFKPENIVTVESIDADKANDTTWTEKKFNYWGYPDSALASYFREAINKAERDHERLFLTHLTGLTHQPWDMPGPNKTYDEMIGSETNPFGGKNIELNKFLNTVGVNDRWYETFLNILEETGVANETLIVMTGDHGLSLLEDGSVTPYDNPLVTNFHVPLIFAHPHLPPIEVKRPVSSIQILPTILDLLETSGSLDTASTGAVKDLLPMYEGQSIIRPIITHNKETDNYQFSVMNTGGSMVALRSAYKHYRLIVPLVPGARWRFTDPKKDPQEENPVQSFELDALKKAVKKKHSSEAAKWVEHAARAAAWWVSDNWRRYEYDTLKPQKPHKGWPGGKRPPNPGETEAPGRR